MSEKRRQPTFGIVIVAAGRGERAGASDNGPKQYRDLAGKPVIARTIERFLAWNPACRIVVSRHADDEALLQDALSGIDAPVIEAIGGATRQKSVLCGLLALSECEDPPSHVMIHDAARPFVSRQLLEAISDAAKENPESGILSALPISETLKQADSDGLILATVPRDGLYRAQTPQTFPLDAILAIHREAAATSDEDFTDDAALFEWASRSVRIVEGDSRNVKLTYASDFVEAERMLRSAEKTVPPDVRVGHGYDTHQLVPGDNVILCGVTIPHDRSLSGHSDADVGFHALTDALLATIGAGDIGDHFPPSDPQWRGASSDRFLAHAANMVRAAGATITHCDVTLLCESPKIGPHRETMRDAIAAVAGIARERVSVKATTNERIGFIGRQEGIVALATATAVFDANERKTDE